MGALLLVGNTIGAVFIFGAAWAGTKLLPWFSILTWIAFGLVVFMVKDQPAKRPTRDEERQVKGGGGKVGQDPGKPSAARSKFTSF